MVRVTARSDSMAALQAFCKLVGRSPGTSKLTKELALELSGCSHPVLVYQHIPGVSNTLADALSLRAPDAAKVPIMLEGVPRLHLGERGLSWWLLGE